MSESALGKHPTDSAAYWQQKQDERAAVIHEVRGEYLLVLHPSWRLYQAERKDGRPIAKELAGLWTGPEDFAIRVDRFNSIRTKEKE